MVKVFLHLGWLVAFLVAVSIARPAVHPRVHPPHRYELILPAGERTLHGGTAAPPAEQALADDGAVRSERSTNLSHITGTARKIQMYIKNRYLQILPDGTVNGTSDDGSDYTILQRQSVKTGQLLVQSVATCLFLCMDSCGLLYGARNFTGDCVFNETFEEHRYITYSSSKYSNDRRTLYMALNKRGQPRKVQIKSKGSLGKLFSYVMAQPRPVPDERVRDLAERILRVRESLRNESKLPSGDLATIVLAQHPLRHHGYHHLCPQLHATRLQQNTQEEEDGTDDAGRDRFRCRKRKKRKKKKRRCKEGEEEGEQCQNIGVKRKKKCQEGEDEKECQKRLEAAKRRRKSRNGDKNVKDNKNENINKKKNNKKKQKGVKNKKKFVSDGEVDSDKRITEREGENQRDEFSMTTHPAVQRSPIPSSHLSSSSTVIPTASSISTTSTTIPSVTVTSSTSVVSLPSTTSTITSSVSPKFSSATSIAALSSKSSTSSVTATSSSSIVSVSSTLSTRTNIASATESSKSSVIPVMSLSSSASKRTDISSPSSSSGTSTSIGTVK